MDKDTDFTKKLEKLKTHIQNTKRFVEKRREANKELFAKKQQANGWKNRGQKRKI